ncbi:MAG: hypothetical protein K2Y37_08470 [Pirellulales bacterium]|nr:hypothetical protein [Pirellulales bacterium]
MLTVRPTSMDSGITANSTELLGPSAEVGWRIVHALPGRIRFRHPRLRGAIELAEAVVDELLRLPGVHHVGTSTRTGSVLVRFDHALINSEQIESALDGVLLRAGTCPQVGVPSWDLTQLSLATGALTEFATIAAAPPTALLLAGALAPTVATACSQLARGRVGSPLVSTVILASTVATGNYFTAALMAWFLRAWDRQYTGGIARARYQAKQHLRARCAGDEASNHDRLSDRLERAIDSACEAQTERGGKFADRAALPTLTTAAIGLAAADLTTAAAILRPDYATTPKRSAALEFACLAGKCAQSGALILEPTALERIAAANVVVIDAELVRRWSADRHAIQQLERLRTELGVRVGVLGVIDELIALEVSGRYQPDFVLAAEGAGEAAFELQRLQRQGHRVVLITGSTPDRLVTQAISAAIQLGDAESSGESHATALVLDGDAGGIVLLWQVARQRRRHQQGALWTTALANAGCVAGAFLCGFTGLHVVLLTNMATWGVHRASLRMSTGQPLVWQVPAAQRQLERAAAKVRTTYNQMLTHAVQMQPTALTGEVLPAALAT